MKNLYIKLMLVLFILSGLLNHGNAQAPEGIIYQAEARNDKGKVLLNTNLEVKITIQRDDVTGATVWEGLHNVTTNDFGMFVLVIGEGTSTYIFEDIQWASHLHFLNVQVKDPKTGDWVDMGTTQLLSVPYALHAKTAKKAIIDEVDDADSDPFNEIQNISGIASNATAIAAETARAMAAEEANAASISGLGTMAYQDHTLVNIMGGDIDGTTIGAVSPASGKFSTLETTGNFTMPPSTETNGIVYSGANTLIHTFGDHNTFMGEGAGNLTTTSQQNVGFGKKALRNTTTGSWNTALGFTALEGNISGYSNTALGTSSMATNISGASNTAVGTTSMMANKSGKSNTAIGGGALNANTTGNYNVAIGAAANTRNKTGSNNTMVGTLAGGGADGYNKSGSVFLGYQAGMDETESNKLYIENSSSAAPLIYGEFDNDMARINGTLEVSEKIKIEGGNPGAGKVLTSDGSGLASWVHPDDVIDDNDATNELNTDVSLNGMTLEVTDAGGTKSADLSSLVGTGESNSCDIILNLALITEDIGTLLSAGVNYKELITSGRNVYDLLDRGISISELLDAGVSISDFIDAGAGVGWLEQIGAEEQELIDAGLTGTFTDERDNREYKWVKIGTQVWMAENLAFNASGSWAYNDDENNVAIYGRLYDWATVMDGAASSIANPSGVQGVCPAGWHLPSDAEWTRLENYLSANGFSGTEGTALKATSGWHVGGNGTDFYGFSGLPGGLRRDGIGFFCYIGYYGHWWSATGYSSSHAGTRGLLYDTTRFDRSGDYKEYGFSVRCVRD